MNGKTLDTKCQTPPTAGFASPSPTVPLVCNLRYSLTIDGKGEMCLQITQGLDGHACRPSHDGL